MIGNKTYNLAFSSKKIGPVRARTRSDPEGQGQLELALAPLFGGRSANL